MQISFIIVPYLIPRIDDIQFVVVLMGLLLYFCKNTFVDFIKLALERI